MGDSLVYYQRNTIEVLIRIILLAVYLICEIITPFQRILQPEELWLYRYPISPSYIPMPVLWILALTIPLIVITFLFCLRREGVDLTEALWCFSLIVSLNGAITNVIKVMVGRPRPDYIERCFPDGQYRANDPCTGNVYAVIDGRKSFPSGHSSVAFASFGFLSLYLAAKLHIFTSSGKGSGIRIITVVTPLFFAICVAISRTCDYHHHWQDVLVGSIIGIIVSYFCYFQYYPPLLNRECHLPWKALNDLRDSNPLRVKEI